VSKVSSSLKLACRSYEIAKECELPPSPFGKLRATADKKVWSWLFPSTFGKLEDTAANHLKFSKRHLKLIKLGAQKFFVQNPPAVYVFGRVLMKR